MVKLYPNGTIYVSPPALITTACKLNVENFPMTKKYVQWLGEAGCIQKI